MNLHQYTKELFEGLGWKYFFELDGFRKKSNFTQEMWSAGQIPSHDDLSFLNAREIAKEVKRRELKAENNILAMLDGRCRGYIKRFKSPNVQDWHLEIEQQLKELEEE